MRNLFSILEITLHQHMLSILLVILLGIIRPSVQTTYSCDPSESCGCSLNSATVSRIVGGENATLATWSWVVSISIDGKSICGGSIISSSWIITAAHCVFGDEYSPITVYAGSINLWFGTQIRSVERVIIHPQYNNRTQENDIALLELDYPFNMTDANLKLICLPSVDESTLLAGEWPPPNTSVVAVGWGTLLEDGSTSEILQQVTLETVEYSSSTCTSSVTNSSIQFCAGVSGGGKDTCQGDSGGPLMMFSSDGRWILVGVTSFGIGCARPEYSGVYTRVAAFQDWIGSITGQSSSSTQTSTTANPIPLHSSILSISSIPILLSLLISSSSLLFG